MNDGSSSTPPSAGTNADGTASPQSPRADAARDGSTGNSTRADQVSSLDSTPTPEPTISTGVSAIGGSAGPEGQGGGAVRHPLLEMLVIAAPAVVTMTSYTVMQFIDRLVVTRIGPDPSYPAAQFNGAIASFVMLGTCMGFASVVNSFVSQNLGAGKPQRGAAYAWNGFYLMLALWACILLPYAWFLPTIVGWSGNSPEVVHGATVYARILVVGGLLMLFNKVLANYFYGMHRPAVVMIAALVGNLVNLFANITFIFGQDGPPEGLYTIFGDGGEPVIRAIAAGPAAVASMLGIPAMGIAGAALATILATAVELLIPLMLFISPKYRREFGTMKAWRPAWIRLRGLLAIGWPAAAMFGNELACWNLLTVWLAPSAGRRAAELGYAFTPEGASLTVEQAGDVHNAVGGFALQYMHLAFMPAVGLSIAVSAIVGRCMGMRRPDLAFRRAMLGLAITVGYMGTCAVLFLVFRHELIDVFVHETMDPAMRAEIIAVGAAVLVAAAVFQVFDAIAITLSGALRGAGDTVWPGIATMILSWLCIVGGGWILSQLFPQWGALGPWIGAAAFIIMLGLALAYRFWRGNWRTLDLADRSEKGDAKIGEPAPAK